MGSRRGALYFKAHNDKLPVGVELSIDSIGQDLFAQAGATYYLKPHGTLSPYLSLGAGVSVDPPGLILTQLLILIKSEGYSAQLGGGVDLSLTDHIALNLDARVQHVDVKYFSAGPLGQTTFTALVAGLGLRAKFESPITSLVQRATP